MNSENRLRQVDWQEIGEELEDSLDYIVDYLTTIELFAIRKGIENGPQSNREIWNKFCLEKKLESGTSVEADRGEYSDTEYYDKVREKLKEENIDFPSYYRVKNSIQELESFGIFVRRNIEKGKADFLWVVNPRFKKRWDERRREIIKEIEQAEDSHMVKEKYADRVVDFYNLSSAFMKRNSRDVFS